jgi:hypothetical protein
MSIVKYRLEQGINGEGLVPIIITDGGHYLSPIDNTLLGWCSENNGERYRPSFNDNIIAMTKTDVVERALEIHSVSPYANSSQEIIEMGMLPDPLTETEVVEMMEKWYDDIYQYNSGLTYTPTANEVNVERERRIALGCNVTIVNVGTIYVTGREQDIRNMSGLGQAAIARIVSGDTTTLVPFRDGYDIIYNLNPSQMLELWQKSAGYVSDVYQASWTLKANTIPFDYKINNTYWPSKEI